MWTALSAVFSGLMSGFVGPLFQWLNKKQDTQLAGFQTAAGVDEAAYSAWLQYQIALQQTKLSANSWWGAKLLYLIVGGTAAVHTAAIFIDSTFKIGCDHYGCLGVPSPPGIYATFEQWVVGSLFVVALTAKPLSTVSAWLNRK